MQKKRKKIDSEKQELQSKSQQQHFDHIFNITPQQYIGIEQKIFIKIYV